MKHLWEYLVFQWLALKLWIRNQIRIIKLRLKSLKPMAQIHCRKNRVLARAHVLSFWQTVFLVIVGKIIMKLDNMGKNTIFATKSKKKKMIIK